METLEQKLTTIAQEHKLTVIEEPGLSGPMYRILPQADVKAYLAAFYDWHPERMH